MEASRATPAADRKRKRSAPEPDRLNNNNSADGSVLRKEGASKPSFAPPRPPPPSEEEVDEFFTLLRRIHSTVKRSGGDNRTVRSTRFERELPLTPPLVNGGSSDEIHEKMDRVEEGADNGVMIFDLNAVPEEAHEANGC